VDHASWRSFEDPGTIDLAPAAVPPAFRYAQTRRHGEKTLHDELIVLGTYKARSHEEEIQPQMETDRHG
jgi:hypothetical protein